MLDQYLLRVCHKSVAANWAKCRHSRQGQGLRFKKKRRSWSSKPQNKNLKPNTVQEVGRKTTGRNDALQGAPTSNIVQVADILESGGDPGKADPEAKQDVRTHWPLVEMELDQATARQPPAVELVVEKPEVAELQATAWRQRVDKRTHQSPQRRQAAAWEPQTAGWTLLSLQKHWQTEEGRNQGTENAALGSWKMYSSVSLASSLGSTKTSGSSVVTFRVKFSVKEKWSPNVLLWGYQSWFLIREEHKESIHFHSPWWTNRNPRLGKLVSEGPFLLRGGRQRTGLLIPWQVQEVGSQG